MSVAFKWNIKEFDALVQTCITDDATPFILNYMPKKGKIVDAGCGLGRYVAYLSKLGYEIEGIELESDTIKIIKKFMPSLNIKQGDITKLEYPDNSISGVICLGVVEHFIQGPEVPLKEIWRILKPNHFAVITVPSLNYIRLLKYKSGYYFLKVRLKQVNAIRKLFKKKPIYKEKISAIDKYKYAPYLTSGAFFEYRFTKKEFENELIKAGFTIIESVPISHIDGIYHEFGRLFVSFKNWKFKLNFLGKSINYFLTKMPFYCNHMHLCVVKK